MAKVTTNFSMSLDGFVALPNDDIGPLFDWYFSGDTAYTPPGGSPVFKVSQASYGVVRDAFAAVGALVVGRRLFDHTHGWGGRHTVDAPVFVMTHSIPDSWANDGNPFTFVTDGVASAIAQAQAVAGEKSVAIASPNVLRQAMRAGLVDEVHVDLIPVLLGQGIRMFETHEGAPISLGITQIIAAPGVTHLAYRVMK
jgi:dihydrofolate reductase